MEIWELECLYNEEITAMDAEQKWFEVWYSQFDYAKDIIHPKGV